MLSISHFTWCIITLPAVQYGLLAISTCPLCALLKLVKSKECVEKRWCLAIYYADVLIRHKPFSILCQ